LSAHSVTFRTIIVVSCRLSHARMLYVNPLLSHKRPCVVFWRVSDGFALITTTVCLDGEMSVGAFDWIVCDGGFGLTVDGNVTTRV